MSLSKEDDQVFAVKNVLAGSVKSGGSYRDCSVENDHEIELLDLAEELLEKLAEILESHEIA
jgi:hypothetical protein